ncbi:hypothetical protein [Planctomicrobium sp. SH527]|uniref:hypothetical protein n=1 Tax=Planctomicrobium sp. SH527 TaxID=3448123 RepID=UPI003F5BD36E
MHSEYYYHDDFGYEDRSPLTLTEILMAIWCAVMPISTVLIIPTIQGTLPAVMVSVLSVFWILSSRKGWTTFTLTALFLGLLFIVSQAVLRSFGTIQLENLRAIENDVQSLEFRTTTITQTLYLIPCITIFAFFREYFRPRHFKYVFFGAWLFVGYGFYEYFYFAMFGESGDFISNRTFQSGDTERNASWTQTISLGPLNLMRMKSFTPEPSFFAISAVPYFALAFCANRALLTAAMFAALALSFSTSSYIGIVVSIAVISFLVGRIDLRVIAVAAVAFVLFALVALMYPDVFASMFADKFSAENQSGQSRSEALSGAIEYFKDLPFPSKLFGIGFGTVYLPATIRALIDLGLIGLLIYLLLFLKPVVKLERIDFDIGIRAGLVAMLVLYTLACEEIFLPTTWMFLGIAYNMLDHERELRRAYEYRPQVEHPVYEEPVA